jgi:diadenosine tetraphosphate (Ap4A) HIT family hydrolase
MVVNDETEHCFICKKHRGELPIPGGLIYEDDLLAVCHAQNLEGDPNDTYLGYLIIENKRHIPGLAEQTEAEARALGIIASRLARALKVSEGAEHVYEFVTGHGIAHLHIHIVARYPGAPREYWGMRVNAWPAAPHGGLPEIEALCKRLRTYLAKPVQV